MHATRYRGQHGCDTQQQTVVGCDTQQQTVVDTGCSMHPTPPAPASWWPKCRLLPAPQTRTPVYVSRVHKCEYLHVRANMRANVPVCMYASTYVRVHVCMCVGIYVYMHICIYQTHAYSKHTYKHTRTHSLSHTHAHIPTHIDTQINTLTRAQSGMQEEQKSKRASFRGLPGLYTRVVQMRDTLARLVCMAVAHAWLHRHIHKDCHTQK